MFTVMANIITILVYVPSPFDFVVDRNMETLDSFLHILQIPGLMVGDKSPDTPINLSSS